MTKKAYLKKLENLIQALPEEERKERFYRMVCGRTNASVYPDAGTHGQSRASRRQ